VRHANFAIFYRIYPVFPTPKRNLQNFSNIIFPPLPSSNTSRNNPFSKNPSVIELENSMKNYRWGLLTIGLVLLADITPTIAQESDAELIQGTWKITSVTSPTKNRPFVAGMLVRLENGRVSVLGRKAPAGISISINYLVDSTTAPKQMDIVSKSKLGDKDLVIVSKGIYELAGDTFRTCAGFPNADRPESFDQPEGAAVIIITHERLQEVPRKWTDSTGKFSTEASIEFIEDETLILRRKDESLLRIPIARLSQADQDFAQSWLKENSPAPDKNP
jgi:uncharacterized protein (TIGR03067 family)